MLPPTIFNPPVPITMPSRMNAPRAVGIDLHWLPHAHGALEVAQAEGHRHEAHRHAQQPAVEAHDLRNGNRFRGLDQAERMAMPQPVVAWEIPGCIPRRDLSIVGGRAKVGKTRQAGVCHTHKTLLAVSKKGEVDHAFGIRTSQHY